MLAQAKVTSFDEHAKTAVIDLSWENAWKNEINFDGVYVFLKYRPAAEDGFRSMRLAGDGGRFSGATSVPEGFSLGESNVRVGAYAPETRLGFFVFPDEACSHQSVSVSGIRVPVTADKAEQIEVFAIEMVYIPEGGFKMGDPQGPIRMGGSCINGFYTWPDKPMYAIASEDAIPFGPEDGMLFCDMDSENGRNIEQFTIPAEYPKGYGAMWYMKHALTMGQWVHFLNCLTRKQQNRQVWSDVSGDKVPHFYVMTDSDHPLDRNEVFCQPGGHGTTEPITFYTSVPHRIANGLNWFSAASFACFAGLRPVSELEYIKACRGPLEPQEHEFAWGSSDIGRAWNFMGIPNTAYDIPVPVRAGALANSNYGSHTAMLHGVPKPFTGDAPDWGGTASETTFENAPLCEGYSERVCRGASYYGVMEMSGNHWEYLVSATMKESLVFRRDYGTGELTEDGEYDIPSWPDPKTGAGFSQKGGNYMSKPNFFVDSRPFGTFIKQTIVFHGGARVCY